MNASFLPPINYICTKPRTGMWTSHAIQLVRGAVPSAVTLERTLHTTSKMHACFRFWPLWCTTFEAFHACKCWFWPPNKSWYAQAQTILAYTARWGENLGHLHVRLVGQGNTAKWIRKKVASSLSPHHRYRLALWRCESLREQQINAKPIPPPFWLLFNGGADRKTFPPARHTQPTGALISYTLKRKHLNTVDRTWTIFRT